MALNSTHKRVSKVSDTLKIKKDGYASGGPHDSMIGWKPAKPYVGPPMAKGKL